MKTPSPLPRLADKKKRLPGNTALPAPVEAGIRTIARREGWSRSRVIAWLVCDWFNLNADTGLPMRRSTTGRLIREVRR